MKESGGSSERGRVKRSRRNWGLLRTLGLSIGEVISAHAEALAGVLRDHLWGWAARSALHCQEMAASLCRRMVFR